MSVPLLTVVLAGSAGCGFVPSLPGLPGMPGSGANTDGGLSGGDTSGGLWPDVPPLPGSTPIPLGLPLPAKLLVKGMISAAQESADNRQVTKDYGFKVFQAGGTVMDIGSFYTAQRMGADGWTSEQSCGADSPIPGPSSSPLCLFAKPLSDGFTDHLAIVALPGEGDSGQDQVAYARFSSRG